MKQNIEYYTPNKIYTHKSLLYTCKFIGYQRNKPTYEIVTTNEISGFKVGDKFTPNDPEKWFDITDTFIPPTPVNEGQQEFKKGQKVYLKENTNISQVVDDPDKNWGELWQANEGQPVQVEGFTDEQIQHNFILYNRELFQMVRNLKDCINRLSQDNLSQLERDNEAQWEGEAHELLTRINPNYYKNANE